MDARYQERQGLSWLLAATLVTSLLAASVANASVIYGEDDREDLLAPTNAPEMVAKARSTALLVKNWDLSFDARSETATLRSQALRQRFDLCEDERFAEQPTSGFCSGFLVAPDLMLTAGHCIEDVTDCSDTSFVFDYAIASPASQPATVAATNVYKCQAVLTSELDEASERDFALVRIERAVADREPLTLNQDDTIATGSPLTVIGNPLGLPTKIAAMATVRDPGTEIFFVANLDTYSGNSGSAVFNSETGMVEGILVRGESDFTYDEGAACLRSKVCEQGACRGEDVTKLSAYATVLAEYLD